MKQPPLGYTLLLLPYTKGQYMEQLEGFIAQGNEDKVCKLVCSLYRLKQAGQVWNRTLANTIRKKLGFKMIHSDVGVYILHH